MAISLAFKKKLNGFLRWARGLEAFIGLLGLSLVVGIGAAVTDQIFHRPPKDKTQETSERQAIDERLQKLPLLRKYAESYRLQADGASAIPDAALPPGMDAQALNRQAYALSAAFHAEAEKTAVAIMHARHLPDKALLDMSRKLRAATGGDPDDVLNPGTFGTGGFRACQKDVMSAPGFVPSVESARRIEACIERTGNRDVAVVSETGGGIAAWFLAGNLLRRRLTKSIARDEEAAAAAPPPDPPPPPEMPIASSADITIKKPLRLTPKKA